MSGHACGAPNDIHLPGTVRTGIINDSTLLTVTVVLPIMTFFVRGRIFWAFDVLPAVEGSSIDNTKTISRGITREPAPFQFRVRARHPDVERIIESESADADLGLKEWEY
jgi:hypothetical protein